MQEASKTRAARGNGFDATFLHGRVLDIGCGDDRVSANAEGFDKPQGDANHILRYFQPESFDCVHSSHCLEHMVDPGRCLAEWWSLVKPGGHMIIVVPDEDLYEQGVWPSAFNPDHKHTFRLGGSSSWSSVSIPLLPRVAALPNAEIVTAGVQDLGYRSDHRATPVPSRQTCVRWAHRVRGYLRKLGLIDSNVDSACIRLCLAFGVPVDQTLGGALAQIEVIARKKRTRRDAAPV